MSSENKIVDKIIADAVEAKAKLLEEGKQAAESILSKAREQAGRFLEQEDVLSDAEAEKARGKEISSAEMEAKKMILAERQSCLEATLACVKEKLAGLSGEAYEQKILSMLEKAEKGEEIIFSPKDKGALEGVVTAKGYVVAEETRPLSGGFIVRKGEIEYNYSFEAILAVEKETIEQIAAEVLFA